MSNKEKCKGYCMEFLEQRAAVFAFDQKEFERQFRGSGLLNPLVTGMQIADNLIHSYKFNPSNNETGNEA